MNTALRAVDRAASARGPLLVLIGLVPLVVVAAFAFTRVGSGFMPTMDEGGFVLDYHTEPGTSISGNRPADEAGRGDRQRESECRDLLAPNRRGLGRRPERTEPGRLFRAPEVQASASRSKP